MLCGLLWMGGLGLAIKGFWGQYPAGPQKSRYGSGLVGCGLIWAWFLSLCLPNHLGLGFFWRGDQTSEAGSPEASRSTSGALGPALNLLCHQLAK